MFITMLWAYFFLRFHATRRIVFIEDVFPEPDLFLILVAWIAK